MNGAAQLVGTRVRLHVNLHSGDFTLCEPRSPHHKVASVTDAVLADVTFKVSEQTRQFILAHSRRRVHAWAFGTLVAADTSPSTDGLRAVSYNPYRSGDFHTMAGEPVTEAARVTFTGRKGWIS